MGIDEEKPFAYVVNGDLTKFPIDPVIVADEVGAAVALVAVNDAVAAVQMKAVVNVVPAIGCWAIGLRRL